MRKKTTITTRQDEAVELRSAGYDETELTKTHYYPDEKLLFFPDFTVRLSRYTSVFAVRSFMVYGWR